MADAMVRHMADLSAAEIAGATDSRPDYLPGARVELPNWTEFAR